jgi:hypothetical protein
MKRRGRAVAIVMLLLGAANVGAQTVDVPPLEVGVQGGTVSFIGEGVYTRLAVGPRVTFNLSQRDAIEVGTPFFQFQYPGGLYLLRYKRALRPRTGLGATPYVTVGTGGYYSRGYVRERRASRADGSVAIFPAHATGRLSGLNVASVGGGIEFRLNSHLAAHVESDAFVSVDRDYGALGFRLLAGLSVPIGGYRAK